MLNNNALPSIAWIVVITTFVSAIGGTFLGYRVASLGWLIPITFSLLIIFRNPSGIRFPIHIWLPWILLLLIYLIFTESKNALQRTIIMLCPIIVGAATSMAKVEKAQIDGFVKLISKLSISFYIIILFKTGIVITGMLPARTALAAEAMTGALFCSFFSVNYVLGSKRALAWWALFAAIPYIALTRMGMIAAALTLPLTLAPMRLIKRIFFFSIIIAIAIPIFYSERVQQKMFFSGHGTILEINPGNPDFATHGRQLIWWAMQTEIAQKPYFGHGADSTEAFLIKTFRIATHPHNDWLKLLFEYGYFGVAIFILTLITQLIHIIKRAKKASAETQILFYIGASSFISYVLFMFSDNIILYSAFFGNLHFTILGIAYAAHSQIQQKELKEPMKYLIRW